MGLAQDAVRPGCNVRGLLYEGKREERNGTIGCAVSQRTGGKCVAVGSVRSVVLKQPEPVESAARFLPFSSNAAVVVGRSELVINSNPCMGGCAAGQPLR